MDVVELPFEVMANPLVFPAPGGGWFVGCAAGGGLVVNNVFRALELPGVVTAGCFEEGRLLLAFAGKSGHGTLVAAAVGEIVDGKVTSWADLAALGKAAKPVSWLTLAGPDALLVGTRLAREPAGRGWALHRFQKGGRLVGSAELMPSTFDGTEVMARQGALILSTRRCFDLNLVEQPRPPLPPLLRDGQAWVQSDWQKDTGHRTTLTVDRAPQDQVLLERVPNHLVDGGTFVAWSHGKKLVVRRDDGGTLKPKTQGRWVCGLAAQAGQLAALVRGEPGTAHATSQLLLM